AFAPDGRCAYVVPNGLLDPLGIAVVDTDPASPTFHQLIAGAPIPGGPVCTCIEADPAGVFLYLGLNNFAAYDLAIGLTAGLTPIDFDPTTPGVQHLSALGNGFGSYINDMVVHPRGGVVYCAEAAGMRAVDVDLGSPGLGTSTLLPLGSQLPNTFAVAV